MAANIIGPSHKRILKQRLLKWKIHEYLKNTLPKIAGYVNIDFIRTSLGEQIVIYSKNPGVVVGRKGKNLEALTTRLKQKFNLINPQIKVKSIAKPELNAQLMAEDIARAIERGLPIRRVALSAINRITSSGAIGVEIRIGGKLMKKRSKRYRFQAGLLVHSGALAESKLEVGKAAALTKRGIIGVKVKILPPDTELPDRVRVKEMAEVVGGLEELKVIAEQLADELISKAETGELEKELEEE
ncbi:MAG: 30S ribosomal protein S3 [Candidatus Njordarchaeia archaeon]